MVGRISPTTFRWTGNSARRLTATLPSLVKSTLGQQFTLGLAIGDGLHSAVTTLFQALGVPFKEQRTRYREQWNRPCRKILPLEKVSTDSGKLYRASFSLLLAHEDKCFPGAMIASLSIPWGESKGEEDTCVDSGHGQQRYGPSCGW